MTRLKVFNLMLMALVMCVLALGASASTASALELPEVKLLGEASFPVTAEGGSKKQTEGVFVQSAAGLEVVAEELKVSLEIPKEGTSGTAHLALTGATESTSKGTKCHTEGDSEGVVLVQGEFHLVPIGVQGELGIWVSLKEATVTCKAKITVAGSWIALVNQGSVGEGVETASLSSHCKGKGTQELSTYWNDEEKPTEKQLLKTNFGLGAESACVEAKEEFSIKFSKPITMKAWGKLVLNSANPWEMKMNQERTFLAAYSGVGTAAKSPWHSQAEPLKKDLALQTHATGRLLW